MAQKTSDLSAIPLCSAHHQENPDSYHRLGEQRFAQEHRIDLEELVRTLNRLFQQQVTSSSAAALKDWLTEDLKVQSR